MNECFYMVVTKSMRFSKNKYKFIFNITRMYKIWQKRSY